MISRDLCCSVHTLSYQSVNNSFSNTSLFKAKTRRNPVKERAMPPLARPDRVMSTQKPPFRTPLRIQYLLLHQSHSTHTSTATTATAASPGRPKTPTSSNLNAPTKRPLSLLPTPLLFRSYLLALVSSKPLFLIPSMRLLSLFAHSRSPFLSPERNRVLHWFLKKTFYQHFCAGETPQEVQKTVKGLRAIGYSGVILTYGRENLEEGDRLGENAEIEAWKTGTVGTVKLAEVGDMVALR